MKFKVNEDKCIGCGLCQTICPNSFEIKGGLARVKDETDPACNPKEVTESCPCDAIEVKD